MREFFHGWRRKMGVMTLVMACVFAAAWVRSQSRLNRIGFEPKKNVFACLSSGQGWIHGQIILEPTGFLLTAKHFTFSRELTDSDFRKSSFADLVDSPVNFNWRFAGFEIGESSLFDAKFMAVPYWSIVLPLTLLSACLLLITPRPKPKQQVNHA